MRKLLAFLMCALTSLTIPATAGESLQLDEAQSVVVATKGILAYEPALYTAEDIAAMRDRADQGLPIAVTLDRATHHVLLYPNPMFDAPYLAPDGRVRPYAGEVAGVEGSSVRFTLNLETNALHGTVKLGEQGLYWVEPVEEGAPMHVWYRDEDALLPPMDPGDMAAWKEVADEAVPGAPSHDHEHDDAPAADAGNVTGPGALVQDDHVTYEVAYLRLYRDSSTYDVISIMNAVDDIYTMANSLGIRLHVIGSPITINTDAYPDPTCGSPSAFLDDFATARPLTGTGHDRNDRAILFTNNANVAYGSMLGCGYVGGSHSWARWSGSDKQKTWAGAHELGHNFGANHDDGVFRNHCHFEFGFCWNNHEHYSIMRCCYPSSDEGAMDMEFSQTSKNEISPWAPRYFAQIWKGSEVNSHNVKLTWWEARYPTSPVSGSEFRFTRTWSANSGTVSLSRHFVGARSCGTEACNRDFGHSGAYTLTTSAVTHTWTYTLPVGANTWRFWPAYQLTSGPFGPFEWHKITVAVG